MSRPAIRQKPIHRGRTPTPGGVVYAASAAQADVADAIAAANPGDTVYVPAGEATWASTVTVSKAISIIGAGSGEGGTILTDSGALTAGFFKVTNVTSASLLRISGFRFIMLGSTIADPYSIVISSAVSLSSLRIDHNRFDFGNQQIYVTGSTGVIDHNTFYNGNKAIQFSAGTRAQADASWESMAAGTADALFVEDNTFTDDASYPLATSNEKISTFNGGKLVVRYNTFDFTAIPHSGTTYPCMTHGNDNLTTPGYWQASTANRRGQSVVEFYENTISAKRCNAFFIARGSANLIYNNDVTCSAQVGSTYVYFYEEEHDSWPAPLRTAWPAEDQVHNTFIWGNTYNGGAYFNEAGHVYVNTSTDYIQLNRDYFLHAPEATGGSESFTGLNGASGSYPTDGETLPTYGTMVFSADGANAYYGYAAYTYPHPLAA